MIRVEDLDLDLGGRPILRSVGLQVAAGSKVTLAGESGSGKTTLLRALLGMHRPQRGRIILAGLPLEPRNLPAIRSRLFYLPQEIRPLGEETTQEFIDRLSSFRATRHEAPTKAAVAEVFDTLRLGRALLTAPLASLSGGERQRVGLARGLLLQRELLLLDEATSAIDEENRGRIIDYLVSLEGVTILAITHDRLFSGRADQHYRLAEGQLHRTVAAPHAAGGPPTATPPTNGREGSSGDA